MDVPGKEGTKTDGVYNLAQHTNQYPYTETAEVMDQYNDKYGTDYPFLHFMREGREEIINFCEKQASAMLYSNYTANYIKDYETNGGSPFYDYDGIRIKTDITSTKLKNNTRKDAGPYKHIGGKTEIEIADDKTPGGDSNNGQYSGDSSGSSGRGSSSGTNSTTGIISMQTATAKEAGSLIRME